MSSKLLTCLLACVAWIFLVGALLHLCTSDRHVLLAALHGSAGWWLLPTGPLALFAWLLGRRRTALLYGALALLHLAWVTPGHGRAPAPGPPGLRVGSSNLFAPNPTPAKLVRELLALDADIWCLQELTPEWQERLDRGGSAARWPHRHFEAQEGGFGMGLLSKIPPQQVQFEDMRGVTLGIAQFDTFTLVCVHPEPPRSLRHAERWHVQLLALQARLQELPRPLILAGDLNATRHHPSYQRLVRSAGLHDTFAEVGRASTWSWPAPPYLRWVPWMRLDHVLLSDELHARSARTGQAQGSDHRPLLVELTLERLAVGAGPRAGAPGGHAAVEHER
jgi:endonuclease/exonuclease/phosphatase (EEP) superfamily protein YafD